MDGVRFDFTGASVCVLCTRMLLCMGVGKMGYTGKRIDTEGEGEMV